MHELSIAEGIRDIAVRHAQQARACRVTGIYLVLGQLTSVVDDSLQFYWKLICQGTLAEGARLHFERVPAKLVCLECGQTYTIPGGLTACPQCHSGRVRVVAGEEFRVESLEIEMAPEPGLQEAVT